MMEQATGAIDQIDQIDRQILQLLEINARRTFGDIGARVGLSAPAVKRRVDHLENIGVIYGYTAVLGYAKFGRPLEAFIELRFAGKTEVEDVELIAADIPEIEGIWTVAGDPDGLAWIRVRDVNNLKDVVDQLRVSGKIIGTKTLIVLDSSMRSKFQRRTRTQSKAPDSSGRRTRKRRWP